MTRLWRFGACATRSGFVLTVALLAGSFGQAMNGEDDDPLSQEDCEVTFNLCEEMSRHFTNKVERGQALEAIMERYLGMTVRKEYPNSSISKALTDGSICCDTFYSRAPLNAPVYIQAVKAEVGGVGLGGLVTQPISWRVSWRVVAAPAKVGGNAGLHIIDWWAVSCSCCKVWGGCQAAYLGRSGRCRAPGPTPRPFPQPWHAFMWAL